MTTDRVRLYDKDRLVVHDTIDTGWQVLTRCGKRASWLLHDYVPHMSATEKPVDCPECLRVLDEARRWQEKRSVREQN